MDLKKLSLLISLSVSLGLTVSCGAKKVSSDGNSSQFASSQDEGRTLIDVPISLHDQGGFGLVAAADSFKMNVEGCASGYSIPETVDPPTFSVYKFDVGCRVKLTSLTLSGTEYTPKAGSEFTTHDENETAIFESASNEEITVTVSSQLSDPISGGLESVSYSFTSIDAGTDETIAQNDLGDSGHGISVAGEAAPAFTIHSYNFTGITIAGAGQFDFVMECESNIAGTAPNQTCESQNMVSDVKYKLVEDTYGGSLTPAEAGAIFDGSELSVSTVLDVGTGGTTNGGFQTDTLVGPPAMHTKPNMILILQVSATSYRYYNIDLTTL